MSIALVVLGGLAVQFALPRVSWCSSWPARLALAHLIGAALMAWSVTLAALAFGRLSVVPAYCAFAIALLLCLRRNAHPLPPIAPPASTGRRLWGRFLILAVALGILSTGSGLLYQPTLGVDAHTIWAIKAKAFFLDGSLRPLLQGCCGKPNYPLLFPLQSWWIYHHLNRVDDWWHQANGFFFYLDGVALAFAGCRPFMSANWAWTAAALVANNPINAVLVTRGFADSALTAYFLASTLFLVAYVSRRDEASRIPAPLLLLGALQTKNEGLAWAVFAAALLVGFEVKSGRYRRAASTIACFLVAVAPWQFFLRVHSLVVGPEEPLASLQTLELEWWARLKMIVLAHFSDFGPASLPFLLVLCLPMIWLAWRRVGKPALALIGAQFAAYLIVYFVVANPLYQLTGFVPRGLGHLSPALLVTCLIGYHGRESG